MKPMELGCTLESAMSGVLFVSPRPDDAAQLCKILSPLPFAFSHVRDIGQARGELLKDTYSVILTEADLPDGAWLDVLTMSRQLCPGSEVIVTDVKADGRFWAEAINLGAYDLLAQPFYESEVRRILSNACSRAVTAAS